MKATTCLLRCLVLVLGLTCVFDGVSCSPKKGGGFKSKGSKMSTSKKVGLGLAGAAAGAAGTAYIGHKMRKKAKKFGKGFRNDDDRLACWVCGVAGAHRCPQGEHGILVKPRNTTIDDDEDDFPVRRRFPDDDDPDQEDEWYDAYFGTYVQCPEHADSCLTLYSDNSREKVLMRNCFDEGLFGCYDSVPGLNIAGFSCFCRHDLCNSTPSVRWMPSLGFLLALAALNLFVRA